jgi:hypothetical protein
MSDEFDIQNTDHVAEVAEGARAAFSLKDRLQGLSKREATVVAYTDEVLGEKHGIVKAKIDDLKALIKPIEGVVLSQEVIDATNEEIAKAQPALEAAETELLKTAIEFKLRAVPPIAEKVIERDVRKALGIKGSLTEESFKPFTSLFNAHLLSQQLVSYTDRQSGTVAATLSVDEAQAIADFLPKYEYAKLRETQDDLQLKNAIGLLAVDSADFSQAG